MCIGYETLNANALMLLILLLLPLPKNSSTYQCPSPTTLFQKTPLALCHVRGNCPSKLCMHYQIWENSIKLFIKKKRKRKNSCLDERFFFGWPRIFFFHIAYIPPDITIKNNVIVTNVSCSNCVLYPSRILELIVQYVQEVVTHFVLTI